MIDSFIFACFDKVHAHVVESSIAVVSAGALAFWRFPAKYIPIRFRFLLKVRNLLRYSVIVTVIAMLLAIHAIVGASTERDLNARIAAMAAKDPTSGKFVAFTVLWDRAGVAWCPVCKDIPLGMAFSNDSHSPRLICPKCKASYELLDEVGRKFLIEDVRPVLRKEGKID